MQNLGRQEKGEVMKGTAQELSNPGWASITKRASDRNRNVIEPIETENVYANTSPGADS